MSAQAEQACTAVLRSAEVGKLLSAHHDDVGHRSQRLHVVDHGWAAPETDYGREGRTNTRNAAFTFQGLHQRRLFTYFVCARAGMPVDVELASAAKDVLAQEAAPVGTGQRLAHDVHPLPAFAPDLNVT